MQKENEKGRLIKYFIEHILWKNNIVPINPCLMWTYDCNLQCEYCYMKDYGKEYYNGVHPKSDVILRNTKKLIDFYFKKQVNINMVDIFTAGSMVSDGTYGKYLDILINAIRTYGKPKNFNSIGIPVNPRCLLHPNTVLDQLRDRIKILKNEFKLNVTFSMSTDGPFSDFSQRKSKSNCTEDYLNIYDEMRKATVEFRMGFHPMTYSKTIDNRFDNAIFMDNIYGSHYNLIVRNYNWTPKQCKSLYWFYNFWVSYVISKVDKHGRNPNKVINVLSDYNLLSSFTTVGRGYSCSIQNTTEFMMHDEDKLILVPCHRQAYPELHTAYVRFNDDNSEWYFEGKNIEYYISLMTADSKSAIPCSSCCISHLCSSGCPAANFEANDSPAIQMPTTCMALVAVIKGTIDALQKSDYLRHVRYTHDSLRQSQISYVSETPLDKIFDRINNTWRLHEKEHSGI